MNGALVYRPYRGCVTLRKHIYIYITCKRQNHNFLSNKYTSQALNRTLQTTKNELWKTFRLTSFQKPISIRFIFFIDCEQSLFFFRFSMGSVRARERRAAKPRDASPILRLQSRAWSFACLGRFARRTKKKERLLVVYILQHWVCPSKPTSVFVVLSIPC